MLTRLFLALAVPAIVAAAAVTLRRTLGASERSSPGDSAWSAGAIGIGYIAAHAAIAPPAFPPVDVTDRILGLSLAATGLAAAEALLPLASWIRLSGRFLLLSLCLVLLLGPVLRDADLSLPLFRWSTITTALAFLTWLNLWALERAQRRH